MLNLLLWQKKQQDQQNKKKDSPSTLALAGPAQKQKLPA
jgi:hypothetical protein